MKEITQHLTPGNLSNTCDDWQVVNPLLFARKLNKLLRSTEFRREFHRCSLAADAVKRWEVLEHFGFDRYPEPRRPLEGEQFLYPWQVVTLDWDWDLGPGRRPLYHQFVMPSLCHWRASADLMLARRLMSDLDWVVVSSDKHTAVIAPEQHLIWDMTYYAMNVSAQSTLQSVFGDDLKGTDYTLYLEEYPLSRYTIELMHIWDLIDARPPEERGGVIEGMANELECLRSGKAAAPTLESHSLSTVTS